MKLIIIILTIWIFLQTVSYGIFEYNKNKNKLGGIIVFSLATIGLFLPNIAIFILY